MPVMEQSLKSSLLVVENEWDAPGDPLCAVHLYIRLREEILQIYKQIQNISLYVDHMI